MDLQLTPARWNRGFALLFLLGSLSWTACRASKQEDENSKGEVSAADSDEVLQRGQRQAGAAPAGAGSAEPVVDAGCPHLQGEGCAHGSPAQGLPAQGTEPSAEKQHSYGEPLGSGAASVRIDLVDMLRDPSGYHGKRVELSGIVERACTRRGCWMELAPKKGAPGCRVTFKDYSFLIPTDSAGKRAAVEGTVQVTEVEAPAVAHYESEGAQFPQKTKDGRALEVRVVATGVQLSES